jgi:hypothetical protein
MEKKRPFKATALLPPNDVLDSAGTHLYRIGLSLYPFGSKRRNIFHNPILAFIMILIYWSKAITAVLLPEDNEMIFKMIGDYQYFMNGRIHMNLAVIPYMSLALISQMINAWNYYNDIKPSYLKPFEMMSGLVSPKTIGLTNRDIVYKIMKRSKLLFRICGPISQSMLFAAFLLPLILFSINFTLCEFLVYGIIHCIISSLSAYYSFCFHSHSVVYFHIICYYLRLKLQFINNQIKAITESGKKFNETKLLSIIGSLQEIYSEISDYNNNYWSKYLFANLAFILTVCNVTLFHTLFGNTSFTFKIWELYANISFALILMNLLISASAVYSEAKRSYKLLNKLFICSKANKIRANIQIKVRLKNFFNNF